LFYPAQIRAGQDKIIRNYGYNAPRPILFINKMLKLLPRAAFLFHTSRTQTAHIRAT